MKQYLFFFLIFFTLKGFAQSIFKEKWDNCRTEHFVFENDSISLEAKEDIHKKITKLQKTQSSVIKGELLIQVLVAEDGTGCILSFDDQTNLKVGTKVAELIKEMKWAKTKVKTSVILGFIFNIGVVEVKRYGLDAKRGLHQIYNE
jgi:hypothetical protein